MRRGTAPVQAAGDTTRLGHARTHHRGSNGTDRNNDDCRRGAKHAARTKHLEYTEGEGRRAAGAANTQIDHACHTKYENNARRDTRDVGAATTQQQQPLHAAGHQNSTYLIDLMRWNSSRPNTMPMTEEATTKAVALP